MQSIRAVDPKINQRPFKLIGELMNNSFARARRAWTDRDIAGYQHLARLQTERGADALTFNLDGTQKLRVRPEEMIAFLPDVVPAVQEVTSLPLAFDNPSVDFHRKALEVYDAGRGGPAIFNSVAASREDLDAMYELIAAHDTRVIVMASERFEGGGSAQCFAGSQVHESTRVFAELLHDKAGRGNDHLIDLQAVDRRFPLG